MSKPPVNAIVFALGLLGSALSGCGGTTAFTGASQFPIAGQPPPPPPPKRVEVAQDRIIIREKIQFEFDKAVIREESHNLLNEVAEVIQKNPQIKKISVEGHADAKGTDKYNQRLSEERAAAVVTYLTEHGVDAARLSSKGWGESKPIDTNDTEEGRAQNRRVEFLITEQDEVKKTFEVDPKTGERREVTK